MIVHFFIALVQTRRAWIYIPTASELYLTSSGIYMASYTSEYQEAYVV